MKARTYLLLVILALPLLSCSDREVSESLNNIESYIRERPDSALQAIRTIDTTLLDTRALRAKYSLLHAMALDKNYIDTTDVRVVLPAVDYYSKHRAADEKMKAYYYHGRILYNAGDYSSAAISFSKAESICEEVSDIQSKGLLYMAFADIYNKTRNKEKEEEYVKKGISAFNEADDPRHSNLSSGRLAILYYGKQEWDKADSLFRASIEQAKEDTVAMSVFLSNYARLKVVQPNQDPQGAKELLKELRDGYSLPLSLSDYGVLAYASCLTGDENTCKAIVGQLEKLPDTRKQSILYWLYRIEQQHGNYKKALGYNIESAAENSKAVERLLSNSITQSLQEYYAKEAEHAHRDVKITRLRFLILILFLVIIAMILLRISKLKRERKEQELDRLLKIGEESNKLLQQANANLEQEKEDLQKQVEEIRLGGAELEKTLESLRKNYANTYKDKFTAIGALCNAYLESKNRIDNKDYIFRKVENLIAYISDDDKLHMRFENQINKDLNNIVKHLKSDLGDIDKKESRFICYCIVGFDPEMIATILGLSLSNVYTKKSRLKERVRNMDSPYKEDYLRML